MATNITFSDIITKLESIATDSGAASVKTGLFANDFDRYKSLATPTVFIEPQSSTVGNFGTITRSFEICVFSLLDEEETNLVTITSSTEVVALKIIGYLKNSFANRDYEFTVASLEWFTEHTANTYTGWVIAIQITTPYEYSIC